MLLVEVDLCTIVEGKAIVRIDAQQLVEHSNKVAKANRIITKERQFNGNIFVH